MKCESCDLNESKIEEPVYDGQNPYRLCSHCYQRLINYALRPSEFFNLASIHGHSDYLNDDFYNYDTGEATQPKIEVIDAENFPFPELDKLKTDLEKLINFACVQYFTSEQVIELLKLHDQETILCFLKKKVNYNRAINYKAYEIAAKVLGVSAGEWIREEWEKRK